MKKILEIYQKHSYIDYIIVVIIGLIMSVPLINIQLIANTHDGIFHIERLIGTINSFLMGQCPPLLAPDFYFGAGYAVNLFYAPISTYIPLIFSFITQDYVWGMKIFTAIFIIISGITMYYFTYQVTQKRVIALISGIFYIIAPYRLGNIYVRYAIAEYVGLAFMPIVFTGLYNLFGQDRRKHFYIAIGAILVILSHTITTFYLSLFCILYVLCNIKKLRDIEIIKMLLINLFFIFIITMFFWLPLFEAKSYTNYAIFDSYQMKTDTSNVEENAIEPKILIEGEHKSGSVILIIGIPTILLGLFSICVIKKVDKDYKKLYILFLIFSMISLFMATNVFPWTRMPDFMCILQFPWRMLGFFAFFITFICGINLYLIINIFLKSSVLKNILVFAVLITSVIYSLQLVYEYMKKNDNTDARVLSFLKDSQILTFITNPDYLPLKTVTPKELYIKNILERGVHAKIIEGKADIVSDEKVDLKYSLNIKDAKKDTKIEIPFLFYPGYEIKIDVDNIKLELIESDNGYLMIQLPNDIKNANIRVEYRGTIITKMSYFVSAVSIILFIYYLYIQKNKGRRRFLCEKRKVLQKK